MTRRSVPPFPVVIATALALALCGLLAAQRGSPGSLLPHGYCFTWNPALLWAHVCSDSLIGAAYVSIPVTLLYLVRKRADLPFNWIVLLFATFIVSCGATHWIEVWTVWNPDYWLSAMVKMITALASILTATLLVFLVPKILAIPTVAELNQAKADLEDEVRRRQLIEEELRAQRADLESRVAHRTAELAKAIDEARSAQATAHEANVQKDRFLAKVSHELRTPLQSTLTWVNVLKLPGADPVRVAKATERIVHNIAAQSRLIDDLLDISRILSGKLHLEWSPVDPIGIVEQAIAVVRDAHGSEVRIEADLSSTVTVIRTDAARLEQVAWNLVSNAVNASSPGERVLVTLRVREDGMSFEVQDWGRGIAPNELVSIFEPFLQAKSNFNRHRGLGLGLAIVRNIVRLMGGDITASSPGSGAGATFAVTLPLSSGTAVKETAAADPSDTGALERLHGVRALYVEDEEDIAEGTALLLRDLGMVVEICTTFDSAVATLKAQRFDLLLTDLMLDEGHSGHELMDILRKSNRSTPAVVFSAFGRHSDIEASLRAGFASHLVKPTSLSELCQAIVQALHTAPVANDSDREF